MAKKFEPLRNRVRIMPGTSRRIALPMDACEHLGWKVEDILTVSVVDNKMVLEKV